MRKKILFTACLFILVHSTSHSQPRMEVLINIKSDSLRKILPGKKGIDRIDCMNSLAYAITNMWFDETPYLGNSLFDTVFAYSTQAFTESKKIKYKSGQGYAHLSLAQCEILRYDMDTTGKYEKQKDYFDLTVRHANEAILIGKELNDNFLIGNAYRILAWVEDNKNNTEQRINYLKTAIGYHEKYSKGQQGTYKDIFTNECNGCKGNEFILAELLEELGIAQKDISTIKTYIEKAIGYYLKAGEKSSIGDCYFRLGTIISLRSDFESGIEYMKKSIPYYQESGNPFGELRSLVRISGAYWGMGDFENGFDCSKKSVQLADKLAKENPKWFARNAVRGQAYSWLGRFYSIAGDNETALQLLTKSKDYYPADAKWMYQNHLAVIGELFRLKGNYDSSMYYLLPLAEKQIALAKIYLSSLYNSINQYDKALPLITEMVKRTKENNDQANLGSQYNILARAYFGTGDISKSLTTARGANIVLKKTGRTVSLIENFKILSEIFYKLGRYDSAYLYIKQHFILKILS
jgi:tetratricopeptide (TPR) repeat protein